MLGLGRRGMLLLLLMGTVTAMLLLLLLLLAPWLSGLLAAARSCLVHVAAGSGVAAAGVAGGEGAAGIAGLTDRCTAAALGPAGTHKHSSGES
jgi:hypothetical protein